MCTIGLIVAMISATDSQPPQPTSKPTVVRFRGGPVIVSHGVRPYLASGFDVQSRTESPRLIKPKPRLVQPAKPKAGPGSPKPAPTSPTKPQPKKPAKHGKWIRFEPGRYGDGQP